MIANVVDFFLHFDQYLNAAIQEYALWTYAIIFIIIFLETGLVVAPFLPGDSLIFLAGAFAANSLLDPIWLFFVITVAAIIGDTVNYWIGHHIGLRIFRKKRRFLKKEHLKKTERFYEKHGGKAIVIGRFIPIIRTFVPFLAGVGRMKYSRFLTYNVAGGIIWTAVFLLLGYYLGNIPIIKQNLSILVLAIIALSLLSAANELIRNSKAAK